MASGRHNLQPGTELEKASIAGELNFSSEFCSQAKRLSENGQVEEEKRNHVSCLSGNRSVQLYAAQEDWWRETPTEQVLPEAPKSHVAHRKEEVAKVFRRGPHATKMALDSERYTSS